jgi:hypothetical protein
VTCDAGVLFVEQEYSVRAIRVHPWMVCVAPRLPLLAWVLVSCQTIAAESPDAVPSRDHKQDAIREPWFLAQLQFDAETGRLAYSVINRTGKAFDVDVDSTLRGRHWPPRPASPGGLGHLYAIEWDGEAYDYGASLEPGDQPVPSDNMWSLDTEIQGKIGDVIEKHQQRFPGWDRAIANARNQKRVVTLRPGEGLSYSLLLQDQPWFDEIITILEASKLTQYRISPLANVYRVGDSGVSGCDSVTANAYGHGTEGKHTMVDQPNGSLRKQYAHPGAKFDLATAKKLQALKTDAKKRHNDAKPEMPGHATPDSGAGAK